MKAFKIFLTLFVLFLLERLLFARFEIFSLTVWLGFAFCLMGGAVSSDGVTPIITAAAYGLISDLSGEGGVGIAMVIFAVSAGLVHMLAGKMFKNSLVVSLTCIFSVAIIGEMAYFLLNGRGIDISVVGLLWSVALPLSVLNTVFSLTLYPIAKRLFAERRGV